MGLPTLLNLNAGSHLSGGTEIHYTLVLHVLKFMRTHKSTTRQPHHTGDDSIVHPPQFPYQWAQSSLTVQRQITLAMQYLAPFFQDTAMDTS